MDMSIRFPGLNLVLDHVPRSFEIFGFEITIYGVLIAIGMLLGIFFVVLEARRNHEDPDAYLDLAIITLLSGVAGARLLYTAFSWSLYKNDPGQLLNIRSGGLMFYGGLLGGVLGGAVYCRIRKKSFWQMADLACMGLLIGQIIGKWGSFFNRESFGEYADNIFSMQLPLTAVRAGEVTTAMREKLQTVDGGTWILVQPLFFYESLWCLLVLLVLMMLLRKKVFQGEIFLRYLAGYGLGRAVIQWFGNTFCSLHRGSCSETRDVQKAGKSTDEKDRERSAGRERSGTATGKCSRGSGNRDCTGRKKWIRTRYRRKRKLFGKRHFCSSCRRNGRSWTARSGAGAIF